MMSFGSNYLHWVKTRTPARINLAASGVSPCPLSELGATIEDLEINGPGQYGYKPLQQAIADHCNVPEECVVSASGTSMANFLVMAALLQPGDTVLIEEPAYDPLLAIARYLGAEVKRFPRLVEGTLSPGMLNDRTKLIVLTNLHNPTCAAFPEPELRRIGELAKAAGARVLADEVYLECMYEHTRSAFHLNDAFISNSSLTKAYGLGGLRCGWVLARPDLARRIWEIKDLVDPSAAHPAEQLSVIAFRTLHRLAARAKTIIETNRRLLLDFLPTFPRLELEVPDHGTCVFPRIRDGDGDGLFELLHHRYDIDVVPGRFFEMPDHVRIGIGVDSNLFAEGLQRLRDALG